MATVPSHAVLNPELEEPIRAELFGAERLEQHAASLAEVGSIHCAARCYVSFEEEGLVTGYEQGHRLHARLEWCQRQRVQTGRRDEKEGWLAEEEGLRDSLLDRERFDLIRLCYPSQVERYRLGFHDGQALLRLPSSGTIRRDIVGAPEPITASAHR